MTLALDQLIAFYPAYFLNDLGQKARDAGQKGGPFGLGEETITETRDGIIIQFPVMRNGLTFGFYEIEKKWGETTYSYQGCSPVYNHQGHCLSLTSRGNGYQSELFSRNGVTLSPSGDYAALKQQIEQMRAAQHTQTINANLFMFPG